MNDRADEIAAHILKTRLENKTFEQKRHIVARIIRKMTIEPVDRKNIILREKLERVRDLITEELGN